MAKKENALRVTKIVHCSLAPGRKVFAVCSAEKAPFPLHSMALTGQRLDRCSLNQTFTEQEQTRGLRGFIVIVGDSNSLSTHDGGPLSPSWLRNGASREGVGSYTSTAYCSNTSSKRWKGEMGMCLGERFKLKN